MRKKHMDKKPWRLNSYGTSTPGQYVYGDSCTQYDVEIELQGVGEFGIVVSRETYNEIIELEAKLNPDETYDYLPADTLPEWVLHLSKLAEENY